MAARAGDFKAALRAMDALAAKVPTLANLPSAKTQHAYFLALDGQLEAARAEMLDVRKLAKLRFNDAHPIYHVIDYVDALIARPNDGAGALRALEASAGRVARLPLAPNWFGL